LKLVVVGAIADNNAKLLSQESATSSKKPIERDSISSEVAPRSVKRGRPPKNRPSSISSQQSDSKTPDEAARTGAQAPIGFIEDSVSTSSVTDNLDNDAKVPEVKINDSKTPKSSLKATGKRESSKPYRLSSNFRQVSFSKDDKSPSKSAKTSPTKSNSEVYHEYDDYNGGDSNFNEPNPAATDSATKSSARKSVASTITPATSRGISTPGSFDFPRGTLLDPNDENDVYRDGKLDDDEIFIEIFILNINYLDGEDTDEEDFNESYVVETSFNEVYCSLLFLAARS
jgi:hypothetical protein